MYTKKNKQTKYKKRANVESMVKIVRQLAQIHNGKKRDGAHLVSIEST